LAAPVNQADAATPSTVALIAAALSWPAITCASA